MNPRRPARARRRLLLGVAFALLVLLPIVPPRAGADDVDETVRETYDAGRSLLAKGDPESLTQAFAILDMRKDEALGSIDYWTLFARVWLALKKDPNELWNVVVVERQQAAPKSIVFDMARFNVADTPEKRKAALAAALKKAPKSVLARTEKAKMLLEEEEEDEADALLEEIFEDDPHALGALMAMARLYLSDGLPKDAIEYCDKALEKHQTAEIHHLKAQCYKRLALNQHDAWKEALASATEAMGLEPTEESIALYNELLQKTGDDATAAKALRAHFERTKHPMLGGLLAGSAFKAGDYEGALMGLSVSDPDDLAIAKGLAVANARLGRMEAARAAAEKVVALDLQGQLFAAELDMHLGQAASVKQRLGTKADFASRYLRARAHAWLGEHEAVQALLPKQVLAGTREIEALLITLLQARVMAQMEPDLAEALREKLLQARFEHGRKPVAQEVRHSVELGTAATSGWPRRALTWFRSRCGTFFKPAGEGVQQTYHFDGDRFSLSQYVMGEAHCGDDKTNCTFNFNKNQMKESKDGSIEFGSAPDLKDFGAAQKAFGEACRAYLGGDLEETQLKFLKVLSVEPGFSRIKVLRAVMRSLAPAAERRDEARAAREAVKPWTDDFELRRLVIYLRAWAGDAELQAEIDDLAAREAQYTTRKLSAL